MQLEGKPWVYTVDGFTWKRWAKKRSEFFTQASSTTGDPAAAPPAPETPALTVPGLPNPSAPSGILPQPPMAPAMNP
jgi:hypothetical protein